MAGCPIKLRMSISFVLRVHKTPDLGALNSIRSTPFSAAFRPEALRAAQSFDEL